MATRYYEYSIVNNEYPYENIFINGKDLSNDYINDIPASNVLLLLIALKYLQPATLRHSPGYYCG